jgi:transcriptional regulator GlxA family with amidase domain
MNPTLPQMQTSIHLPYKETAIRPQWIDDAIDYMMENFSEDLSLDDLANSAGLSKFNFCRQFHRHTGAPPLKWLRKFRLAMAGEILRQPVGWNIEEVAFAVGFNNCAHFSRLFREAFAVTPSEYRNKLEPVNDHLSGPRNYEHAGKNVTSIARNLTINSL